MKGYAKSEMVFRLAGIREPDSRYRSNFVQISTPFYEMIPTGSLNIIKNLISIGSLYLEQILINKFYVTITNWQWNPYKVTAVRLAIRTASR